jgi:TfoX/Sxy family transcriptional regulator of competence genes
VPYDEELAARIRTAVGAGPEVAEVRMFGGLGFLVNGNLAVAASSGGGLLVRSDPEEGRALIDAGSAEPMEMRGRAMSGWLRVPAEAVATDDALAEWVGRGTAYARSLPPKR